MSNTLTIFKNHKKKVFCVHKDSTAFSILNCQSITVPEYMIDSEISDAKDNEFSEVECIDFYNML